MNLFSRKNTAILCILLAIPMLAACQTPGDTTNAHQLEDGRLFEVIGYSTTWSGSAAQINMDAYTVLNHSFAIPRTDGTIRSVEKPYKLKSLVRNSAESGGKVYLAVGGWSYNNTPLDETFEEMASSPAGRAAFVNGVIEACETYSLNGIDLDWEYPGPDRESVVNFEALVLELSEKLKERGLLLSAAVPASAWGGDFYSDAALTCFDHINIMVYDGDAGAGHSPFSYAVEAVDYWKNQRSIPGEKLMLGLPFYARPDWTPYKTLVAKSRDTVPYQNEYQGDHYNGLELIAQKTQYAIDQGLGGVMVWEVAGDASGDASLLNRIMETIEANQ